MIPDPLDALRLPSVPVEPRPAFADALWRRVAGREEVVAQTATVRYFVEDLDAAIAFYRDRLGFEEELHPSPTFAMLYRGDLRLLLRVPGEPHALPDGTLPEPGGWNRISLRLGPARDRRGAPSRRRHVPTGDRCGCSGRHRPARGPVGQPRRAIRAARRIPRTNNHKAVSR